MTTRADWLQTMRSEAWAFGRELRDDLLKRYQHEYGVAVPPPPAKIVDELLTDFLHAGLLYLPLDNDLFAETSWENGKAMVTVNSLTGDMPGVKDAEGVQNVGKWHEAVHVVHDLPDLQIAPQTCFAGFEAVPKIACYRTGRRQSGRSLVPAEESAREFWAEEAGRAAAVSLPSLARSDAFRRLPEIGRRTFGPSAEAWPLLYEAVRDIGVNISALVKQLSLEGWIAAAKEGNRQRVHVQPALTEYLETG